MIPYCLIGCIFVVSLTIISLHWTEIMDRMLNYSMKKKVKTKKTPLWFPSDRKNESAFGPSLEQPNEGTYLPAFISCIILYMTCLLSVVSMIVVHFIVKNNSVDLYLMIGVMALVLLEVLFIRIMIEHYERKYFNNQPYYMNKINDIIDNKDID